MVTFLNRLVNFNYPTAAAAAGDLGGIEVALGKAAMTIGLQTITYNPNVKAIIMAAGEGKASVVRAALEEPKDPARPSSILHSLPNARFYITHGAAMKLSKRIEERILQTNPSALNWAINHLAGLTDSSKPYFVQPTRDYLLIESSLYEASLKCNKPVHALQLADLNTFDKVASLPAWLRANELTFRIMASCASRRLKEKIEGGLKESTPTGLHVLHTAPHHDDIMLSYHGAMHYMLGRQQNEDAHGQGHGHHSSFHHAERFRSKARSRSGSLGRYASAGEDALGEAFNGNVNHFAYLTSGFHSVNDDFLLQKVTSALAPCDRQHYHHHHNSLDASNHSNHSGSASSSSYFAEEMVMSGQMSRDYDDLMAEFWEAFSKKDFDLQDKIENIIFLRKVAEVWTISLTQSYANIVSQLKAQLLWIRDEYLAHHERGDAVPKNMQLLKGCMRESEVDRVWALSRMPMNRIHHMRSK